MAAYTHKHPASGVDGWISRPAEERGGHGKAELSEHLSAGSLSSLWRSESNSRLRFSASWDRALFGANMISRRPLEEGGKQPGYPGASVAQWSELDALIQRGPRNACQGSAEKDRTAPRCPMQPFSWGRMGLDAPWNPRRRNFFFSRTLRTVTNAIRHERSSRSCPGYSVLPRPG